MIESCHRETQDQFVGAAAPLWLRLAAQIIRRLPSGRYRAMNWVCRSNQFRFIAQAPPQLGGWKFICHLGDSISREVCFTGRYEIVQTALLQKILRPGMTFIDVGANWGYFSFLAAHIVGCAGHVISLEPEPRMYQALKTNIALNRLPNVVAQNVAAADVPGERMFVAFDELGGNFGVSRLTDAVSDDTAGFLSCVKPMDLIADECSLQKVDVVKIDVEGAEDLVLAGMKQGLQSGRYRTVFLELHPSLLQARAKSVDATTSVLMEAGYKGFVIDHSSKATRQAAYAHSLDIEQYVRPFSKDTVLDGWPHTFWIAPGVPFDVEDCGN